MNLTSCDALSVGIIFLFLFGSHFLSVGFLVVTSAVHCRSRTAVAPLERLKILLQVQNPHNIKYNGTVQGLKYIWRTEGFRGLFKGNGTNCARIVPNSAVKFFSYEQASKSFYVATGVYYICTSSKLAMVSLY
ncbi:mitochondrial adenine nucleotide transporter ADNT1-like isoform X2 [Olea europaea var. sylvestris]|uniref:mitochondrial adenine nucleotide transporter ADNT1-like isoform X2 n=1 Tax=Olea europaea var. sylvestris TaxID=158386 RepID=UPI000C1D7732|nr:mitochondrial adenine nucleotide transporter ADNT1-like isoform X2 [Olea europaea var. sylvestris]